MCEFFQVGPNALWEWDTERLKEHGYKWLVFWYRYDSCDGGGEAVGLRDDLTLDLYNLGHCSCYGPLENPPVNLTILEFFEPKSIFDPDIRKEIVDKVYSLL